MLKRYVKTHSSHILAISAGLGVVSTAYLSAVAGYRTAQRMSSQDPTMELKEKARLVWRLYIPAATVGAATIVCIAGSKRVDASKTLAAQTALAVSQRAYESYRGEVVEALGEKQDKLFAAKVAEKQVGDSPPSTVVLAAGQFLCCETYNMRYFTSDMGSLQKAVNEVNAQMLKHDYATLWDFQYLVGLEATPSSSQTGWTCDKLLELEFHSIIHDDQPVLAFDYNYVKGF